MLVAFVASSAPPRSAIGNLLAEKVDFFLDRGAEVRVFLETTFPIHPRLAPHVEAPPDFVAAGPAWDFLTQSDLVFFEFSIGFDLLKWLPLLVDEKPRLIATYYGLSPAGDWPGPQRQLLERSQRNRGLLWCADVVVVHSQFSGDELRLATSLPADRLHPMKIPIDLARWQSPTSEPSDAIPDSRRPILLFVGRLAPNKRLHLVIEALARLPDTEAWIVGNDRDVYADQARQSRELAARLGVGDRVRWLGDVADDALPALMRRADVLVLPSIHEGLGIPVLEGQAAGIPVVAARAAALPETIADAGLTFRPADVDDFVRQLRRVLAPHFPRLPRTKRIALVAFRFGRGFIGGAETSLRNIGRALLRQGYAVEFFTTCTIRESGWKNDLPEGDATEDGFLIHRFPIDPHDRARHDEAFRAILESDGRVAAENEAEYLAHSIHSSALIAALAQRQQEFDAIIATPYLHGLTFRVTQSFPDKTLLLPCFHDEPAVRLQAWHDVYGAVAGLLYHSPEEQAFAQSTLGLNHPGASVIGTSLDTHLTVGRVSDPSDTRTLVYCGRYSIQKNIPLLLDFARRYQSDHPNRFRWLFIGEGGERLPAEAWLRDLGRVDDGEKHRVLAQADALVQLSTQESLSLVVLEAWQHATPVIVHNDAPVLVGHLARSGGGVAIHDYDSFAQSLDDLWNNPVDWRARGDAGQRYVRANYLDADAFGRRLVEALDSMSLPLAEQMRRRGLARIQSWSRSAWRDEFASFVEHLLDAEPRVPKRDLLLEPLASLLNASPRQASLLLPVRIHNRGNIPAVAEMTRIAVTAHSQTLAAFSQSIPLSDMILPGQSTTTLLPIDLPKRPGRWTLSLQTGDAIVTLPLEISDRPGASPAYEGGLAPLLESAQFALAQAHARQSLPRDYLDVTEGRFARLKRWLKQKVLNNFKRAYVDVLSAQQSDVNRRLVESVQQLTECCRALDQTVRVLQDRVAELSRLENAEQTGKKCEAKSPGVGFQADDSNVLVERSPHKYS